jgi:hypothetical protein
MTRATNPRPASVRDWIGLNPDELIPHGRTLTEFLRSLASGQT